MDYAFAPGADFYHRAARQLMANRPNTQVIQQRGLNTVADFLTFLNAVPAVPAIQHPAGDLFVVSHGNDVAWLQIRLDGTQTGPTGYEQAEAAAASGSVHIPPRPEPERRRRPDLACGQLPRLPDRRRGPFVDELKVAFGGNTAVTAPLHFHGIFELTGRVGLLELLAYGFTFVSKTAFADKAATAAAFDAIGFTYHDANALPTANWTAWVPSNVRVGHREGKPMYVSLGRTIGSQRTIGLKIEFRHDRPSFTYKITGLPGRPAGMARPTPSGKLSTTTPRPQHHHLPTRIRSRSTSAITTIAATSSPTR